MVRTVLIVLLILLLLGTLPAWPYSAGWGYYPSGGLAPAMPHPGKAASAPAGFGLPFAATAIRMAWWCMGQSKLRVKRPRLRTRSR